jgi:cell division protein FtsW (lipid II flippase)
VSWSASAPAPPKGKTGLALLLFAIAAALLAYATEGLGKKGKIPTGLPLYGIVMVAGFLVAWLVVRKTARRADPVLLPVAALLAGLGFAMIARIQAPQPPLTSIAQSQFTWLMIALLAFVVTLVVIRDDRQLDALTYTIGLAGIVLLLLPVVPGLGLTINGARLWVHAGPLSFQPAEFGKVLIVIFLASYLSAKRELLASGVGRFGLPRVKDLGPVILAWGTSLAVLFLEKDLGASLLFFGVFVVMLWVATGRPGYLLLGLVLFAIGAVLGYVLFAHVQERVAYWLHALDPAHVQALGYGQLAQGWFAMASGGLVGTGLGQGSPFLIPYSWTDFIFAAFGEELGFVGCAALLLMYLVIIGRGLRVAVERTDDFGKLLATGLTTMVALQTFVIVGGVTRLIPLTGITLPFVSYGGSSLVANFVILALLVRVSAGPWTRETRAPEKERKQREPLWISKKKQEEQAAALEPPKETA